MDSSAPKAGKIKVLLVDDSLVALTVLRKMLESSDDIDVVGTAVNGREALKLLPVLRPDVICTDLHMPIMDGLSFTREVMAKQPTPILVISISVPKGSHNVFKLLEAGAVDVFLKPRAGLHSGYASLAPELVRKVRILAGVHVFRRKTKDSTPEQPAPTAGSKPVTPEILPRILIVGASTGGPHALHAVFGNLPTEYPLPIVCIQHISDGFLKGLADWLQSECRLNVRIAQMGETPLPGSIYFPAEGSHLTFDINGKFLLASSLPPYEGHRPSATVTMASAARHFGNLTAGLLLTGMGRDGADGMLAIYKAGGLTVAQNEESCVVYGMPKQAVELGAVQHLLPLNEIAELLLRIGEKKSLLPAAAL